MLMDQATVSHNYMQDLCQIIAPGVLLIAYITIGSIKGMQRVKNDKRSGKQSNSQEPSLAHLPVDWRSYFS